MFRLGSFSHMLCSGSDAEFRQHPLCLFPRHVSGEQRGGAAEILRRIRSIAWENEPNLNILGLSMDSVGQFERIKVINMQMHAYL